MQLSPQFNKNIDDQEDAQPSLSKRPEPETQHRTKEWKFDYGLFAQRDGL